jgi:hypothetical protein
MVCTADFLTFQMLVLIVADDFSVSNRKFVWKFILFGKWQPWIQPKAHISFIWTLAHIQFSQSKIPAHSPPSLSGLSDGSTGKSLPARTS